MNSAEARKAVALAGSEGVARLFSFAFYLIAAQAMGPAGFGVVRYTITLAMVAFGLAQFVSYAIMRELGASRGDAEETAKVLGTGLVTAGAVLAISLVLALIAILAGATSSADTAGLLAVTAGLTVFQLYYSIARGLDAIKRAAVTYAGGSLFQLLVFGAVALATNPSPSAALLIFAGSSVVPVVALELYRPVLRMSAIRVDRSASRRLWAIGGPLIVGQLGFTIWNASDQVWVNDVLTAHQSGFYQAAKNLAQVLMVPSSGVAGIVLPRVAEQRAAGHHDRAMRLILTSTAAVVAFLAVVTLIMVAFRDPIFSLLYGDSFAPAGEAFIGLAVATTVLGVFVMVAHGAIGWGRPRIWTVGYAAAAVVNVVYLLTVANHTITSVAWGQAISIGVAALLSLGWLYWTRSAAREAAASR